MAELIPPAPPSSDPGPHSSSAVADPAAPRRAGTIVWSIAGHDPSSGAGFTADQLTFAAHGLFAATIPTALTAQSTLGVAGVHPVPREFLRLSLNHLLADLPPAGIKIGMLGSVESARVVATFLSRLRIAQQGTRIPVVLDPVLVSSSGRELYPSAAIPELRETLLPLVDYITPNFAELAALTGHAVATEEQALAAATTLSTSHPGLAIAITGGDRDQPTDLLRLPTGEILRFPGEHIDSRATHGTGCAFSSALLAAVVLGSPPVEAVASAKRFVTEGIRQAPGLGHGHGPLELLWPLRNTQ